MIWEPGYPKRNPGSPSHMDYTDEELNEALRLQKRLRKAQAKRDELMRNAERGFCVGCGSPRVWDKTKAHFVHQYFCAHRCALAYAVSSAALNHATYCRGCGTDTASFGELLLAHDYECMKGVRV